MNASSIRSSPTGSSALVAGGTSGIGLATAHHLVADGIDRVVLVGRDSRRGTLARDQIARLAPHADVRFWSVDVSDPSVVDELIDRVVRVFGRLDIAVTSVAAPVLPDLLRDISPRLVPSQLAAVALPPLLLTTAALRVMSKHGGGSIVNVASDAGKVPTPGEAVIGAGMAAIAMFGRVAALEGRRDRVRVNTVMPSLVAGTPTSDLVLAEGFGKRLFEKAAKQAHLGVTGVDDVARLITFLAGPHADLITGQTVSINGGISVP